MTRIALLNIGTELLRGRTVNTNASSIGIMLGSAGFSLQTTLVIHDQGPTIDRAVRDLMEDHDVVLITGGLGPTTDDITKKILLQVFGGEMICHEPTLVRLRAIFERRNMPLLETNRLQSFVPSSCEVIENEQGTAPGMVFRKERKVIVSMPGVPFEMEHLMRKGVLPLLKSEFLKAHLGAAVVRTFGIPESRIAEKMAEIEHSLDPRIDIAYLPSFDGTKIELKVQGPESQADELDALVKAVQNQVAGLFKQYVYSLEDLSPVKLLARHLLGEGKTFGTAESCTGGAIAASLVEQSGISAVMKGGIVAYMGEVKELLLGVPAAVIREHGMVSAKVAEAMAEGARKALGCQAAVSITGIVEASSDAAPEGQTQAWIGFSDAQGTRSTHFKLYRDRKVNIQYATQAALIFALRELARTK